MGTPLKTRLLTEAEYPAWNDLVAAAPEGSIYSTPEYLDVLCRSAGGSFKIIVADRDGEVVGGLPLFERRNSWGTYITGRYLLYYHGLVVKPYTGKYPSERTSRSVEIQIALEAALRQMEWGRIEIKSRSPLQDVRVFLDRGWRAQPSYSYVAPIADLPALWGRVEQNLRRLVTRCEREGLQFSDDDDFDGFFKLHHLTHLRKGASLYLPVAEFRRYFESLRSQDLCRLYQARMPDGRLASTQLVLLGRHPVCHTVSAAAEPDLQKTGATAFLRWKAFERLSQSGFTGNDLTDAQLNPVTHFKSQLGGDLEMSLVLSQPDRGGFRLQNAIYRTGSKVKQSIRSLRAKPKEEGK